MTHNDLTDWLREQIAERDGALHTVEDDLTRHLIIGEIQGYRLVLTRESFKEES